MDRETTTDQRKPRPAGGISGVIRAKKVKSSRARGNDFQDRCSRYLEAEGFTVHNQKTYAKVIKIRDRKTGQLRDVWVSTRNDILGAFDLIAVKAGERVRFIQVTLDSSVSKRVKEVNGIAWPFDFMTVELWQGRDRAEVAVSLFDGTEFREAGRYLRGVFYRKTEAETTGASPSK